MATGTPEEIVTELHIASAADQGSNSPTSMLSIMELSLVSLKGVFLVTSGSQQGLLMCSGISLVTAWRTIWNTGY